MTLFNDQTDLTQGVPALQPDQAEVNYLEYAKSKFHTEDGEIDNEALAKGKYLADERLKQYEQEMAALRADYEKRMSYEQLAAKIEARQKETLEYDAANQAGDPRKSDDIPTPEKIRQYVQETLNNERQKDKQDANVKMVKDELQKTWGTDYANKLKDVIRDLDITQEEASFMAASKPKAFIKLVSGTGTQTASIFNPAPPSSSVRVQDRNVGNKNYSYFQKIYQDDPIRYWSPKVQNELHSQALQQGESFFK